MKFEVELEVADDAAVEDLAEAIKTRLEVLDLQNGDTLYLTSAAITVTVKE